MRLLIVCVWTTKRFCPACSLQVMLPAYLGGTIIGMSGWSLLYASLGAASGTLLDGGEDLATIFAGRLL